MVMTSQDESGKSPQDDHDPLEETQQLNDTSSRSRHKSGRFWIGLSVVVLAGITAAALSIALGGTQGTAGSQAAGSQAAGSQAAGSQAAAGQAAPNGSATRGASPGTAEPSGRPRPLRARAPPRGKSFPRPSSPSRGARSACRPTCREASPAGNQARAAVTSRCVEPARPALQASGIRQYSPMKVRLRSAGQHVRPLQKQARRSRMPRCRISTRRLSPNWRRAQRTAGGNFHRAHRGRNDTGACRYRQAPPGDLRDLRRCHGHLPLHG